jgi:hypothetical protein
METRAPAELGLLSKAIFLFDALDYFYPLLTGMEA